MEKTKQKNEKSLCAGHHCPCHSQVNRRGILKIIIGLLSAPLIVLLGWPFVQSIIGTILRLPKAQYAKIGPMSQFPNGQPVSPKFKYAGEEGYLHTKELLNIWVIKHTDTDVTVFSPICPHLGCQYDWYPEAKKFICPCHGSIYSIKGKVLGGPAPRSLDTLAWKIENGDLYVEWKRFRVGVRGKIRIG